MNCGVMMEKGGRVFKCGGCMRMIYCGVSCQRKHWRASHSDQCIFYSSDDICLQKFIEWDSKAFDHLRYKLK